MDALKFIPQAFFDLIARIVPGFVFLFLINYSNSELMDLFKERMAEIKGSKTGELPIFFVILAAYVIGHLISPLTKQIQELNKKIALTLHIKKWRKEKENKEEYDKVKEEHEKKLFKEKIKKLSKNYDWLRLNKPDAGGHCAKLRAEFTMYNSFATVFAIFFILSFESLRDGNFSFSYTFTLLIFSVLMAYRGRETEKTFQSCITHFYEAATNEKQSQ